MIKDQQGGGRLCCPSSKKSSRRDKKGFYAIDTFVRDFFVRTNLDLFLVGLAFAWYHVQYYGAYAAETEDDAHNSTGSNSTNAAHSSEGHETRESEFRDTYAVLFPWFSQIVGVFVYYLLSRYCHALPYTAVMFIIGFFIGFSVSRDGDGHNAITESAAAWLTLNGEIILLVFLPGLLYLESYNIDVHLFLKSFTQILVLAFPMVLAGTSLTACIAYYIFPYGWSFDLSMTFGSILSATDPVAVAVLLNELGAPPRLKIHISGESLINDGSAVVFYNIFRDRFFSELGIKGVGEDIGWARGFELFFRLSLGGMCIGLAFGVGTVFLIYKLKRRLSGEDSVVQVVITITVAYLAFFVSEILSHCSGIIAVVFLGVTVKLLGESMINDKHLMLHFWETIEWLLNTTLFTLAGCEWGHIMSDRQWTNDKVDFLFTGKDWGYLILLFVLLVAIRFALMFIFYPCFSRIGIGSSLKEVVFMSYGGLRGAVGIALALALEAEIFHFTSDMEDEAEKIKYRYYAQQLFGFVGGVALLTLIVNAPTCGPLLKKLGLVAPTETRVKVIENYRQQMIHYCLVEYVAILSDEWFHDVDYSVVREHVPFFQDITYSDLMAAVNRHKDETPTGSYVKPNLKDTVPYLYHENEGEDEDEDEDDGKSPDGGPSSSTTRLGEHKAALRALKDSGYNMESIFDLKVECDDDETYEQRLIFIKILRSSYHKLIESGMVESRGFIPYSLLRSLDFAEDEAARGLPLGDWDTLKLACDSFAEPAERIIQNWAHWKRCFKNRSQNFVVFFGQVIQGRHKFDRAFHEVNSHVRTTLAFTWAHEMATKAFKKGFLKLGDSKLQRKGSLTSTEKVVLDENEEQMKLASDSLKKLDKMDVTLVKSHYVCEILLNKSASYITELSHHGLMSEKEASEFLEHIEKDIFNIRWCRQDKHKDEMTERYKKKRLQMVPDYMMGRGPSGSAAGFQNTDPTSSANEEKSFDVETGAPIEE